jgi:hypothetical protein
MDTCEECGMSAPPLKKKVVTCQSKRRHPDEITARAAAMRAIQYRGQVNKLWVYPCPECRGWHLTKKNNGLGALVTADNPVHSRCDDPRLEGFT